MAMLPKGYAEQVGEADPSFGRTRTRDGAYTYVIKKIGYEEVGKKGSAKKEHALIFEHRVVASAPLPDQPKDVAPNPVGEDVSYFLPDYGDAQVMLFKNASAYVLGLLGLEKKKGDKEQEKKIGQTIDYLCSDAQPGRGMLIRTTTFRTEKKDGEDFVGHNWFPVAGEANPDAPSVKKRRAELDAEAKGETQKPADGGRGLLGGGGPKTEDKPPADDDAPPPMAEDPPAADPLAGFTVQEKNGKKWYWKKPLKKWYTEEQVRAGQATE